MPERSIRHLFKHTRVIENPPIGRLVQGRWFWETTHPPPPVDSRGCVRFRAGPDGPSDAQIEMFRTVAARYGAEYPGIAEKLFVEYQMLQDNGWDLIPAKTPAALAGATRLGGIEVDEDCTVCLTYLLYWWYPPEHGLECVDHELNVFIRDGQVVDVAFEG